MTSHRHALPFVLMRGGTSKGVFLPRDAMPSSREALIAQLLAVFGSPDVRQIDGLGGADKLTSKAAIMGKPTREDADIDYLFAQVGMAHAEVDFNLNCGNLTAAAAAYAIREGYVAALGEHAQVRIHNVNTGRIIRATVPLRDGEVREDGELAIGGVPGTGAPIDLDFSAATGAITGQMLPLGTAATTLEVPGLGSVPVTVLDGPNLIVLVAAQALGMQGTETPDQIDQDGALVQRMQAIRQTVAERVGLGEYWHSRGAPSTPMLVAVSAPRSYVRYTTGTLVHADEVDLVCRQYSTAATSKALAATVTAAIGMACRVPGTVAQAHMRATPDAAIRLGHPSGVIVVQADQSLTRASIQRTARLIARGEVYLPASAVRPSTQVPTP